MDRRNTIIDILQQHGEIIGNILIIKHASDRILYNLDSSERPDRLKYKSLERVTIKLFRYRLLGSQYSECDICNGDYTELYSFDRSIIGTHDLCISCIGIVAESLYNRIRVILMLTARLVNTGDIDADCRECIIDVIKLLPLRI